MPKNLLDTIIEALLSTTSDPPERPSPTRSFVKDYREQEQRNARVAAEAVVAALRSAENLTVCDRGDHLEIWGITPPDIDMGYRVIREEWSESDDGRPVRVIHEIEFLAFSTVPPEDVL